MLGGGGLVDLAGGLGAEVDLVVLVDVDADGLGVGVAGVLVILSALGGK